MTTLKRQMTDARAAKKRRVFKLRPKRLSTETRLAVRGKRALHKKMKRDAHD